MDLQHKTEHESPNLEHTPPIAAMTDRTPCAPRPTGFLNFVLAFCLFLALACFPDPGAAERASPAERRPLVIGLDADMSKGAAQGGEAIRRGIILAIEEINAAGGVLGRPLELVLKDHRGTPARGVDNIEDFAAIDGLVAVVGGVHTPVALAELDAIHRHEIIYLGPWAAGTPIVDNAHDPNFVFRVSVRDESAGGYLVDAARRRGFRRLGLLLWRTGWGRSNETAIRGALEGIGSEPAAIQWFNSGQTDMSREIEALATAGADVVILVANPVDGRAAIRGIADLPEHRRLPVISHWGITGGDFHDQMSDTIAEVDLSFLQTYSFFDPTFPAKADAVYAAYCGRFGGCQSRADIVSPVGTAHAYDLVHILARAIEQAGSPDRRAVRDSLEMLGPYDGLVRRYDPPFTPARHDALDTSDYSICRYAEGGAIVPIVVP